jgi:hypothetical protein
MYGKSEYAYYRNNTDGTLLWGLNWDEGVVSLSATYV